MKGEVIFPNAIVLLKFPIMKQTHLAILCPSVDNWTRIFALSLPTYLTVQVIYLGLRQKVSTFPSGKSLNLPPGRLAGRCCCSAQPALPCQLLGQSQEFLICCLLLVAVRGTVILFGSMARKRCKSRRERWWMMYSPPMLQQYQIRVWDLLTSLYRWCFCGEKWTQYPAGLYSPCSCKSSNRWCFWGEM